uniref:Uncharacterized protein n=1 Tax=Lactuca sativa TaxID=4236 RepID=A0A9R1VQL2_LACSA|nr:hypothetical protein LSAT_V11C400175780 [Lactuca sativa]
MYRTLNSKPRRDAESYQKELIWSPTVPVLEIARLAFDSGGDPGFVPISPTPMQKGFAYICVADCEGSNENRCELTRYPYGRHFINEVFTAGIEFIQVG